MSEVPVVVMECTDSESRPVLGPAGNKTRSPVKFGKPAAKPKNKPEEVKKPVTVTVKSPLKSVTVTPPSILRRKVSMNASCSSDASSDSSHSRVSNGKVSRRSVTPKRSAIGLRNGGAKSVVNVGKVESDGLMEVSPDSLSGRKRCAWVTANTDPCYAVFHDEEWGVPVHDDKKLFELLSLSTALAELTWPTILSKRHLFREVFHGFDPIAVSKMSDKKIAAPGNPATSLLSEVKLRGFIENARQVCKIADEFGSFDKYIWGFINHKPIVNKFRYPRQVPIKTSKADSISKDLVRRGFRGVGPTVVYSFLQVAGLTNDHLVSCFRFNECADVGPVKDVKDAGQNGKSEGRRSEDGNGLGLTRVIDELRLSGCRVKGTYMEMMMMMIVRSLHPIFLSVLACVQQLESSRIYLTHLEQRAENFWKEYMVSSGWESSDLTIEEDSVLEAEKKDSVVESGGRALNIIPPYVEPRQYT
uniref:DNA glycosylase superfamily protein n=1 Tax=Tanacetum cinerariifolium TaxID=118510 RepID=A0A699HPQ6_TANCI|nr:DNA glycosylase superfamily protein [Tanacetum cinerariifolium]